MEKSIERIINKGEKKYIAFCCKLGLNYNQLITPYTYTLHKLGLLNKDNKDFIRICLKELIMNFKEDYKIIIKDDILYKKYLIENYSKF